MSNNPDGSATIRGDWAGVPQSASGGSTGGSMTFYVDAQRKFITVADPTSIFPIPIQTLYEPEDQTPPQSTLAIGTPQYNVAGILTFVTSATRFTETATDTDSGVENLWYRVYPQNASPGPSYAPVIASSFSFNVTGADGMYNFDEYATDNAGNDENANHGFVYLDNTPPVVTITQPALTQYTHSNALVLAYSVSDGTGFEGEKLYSNNGWLADAPRWNRAGGCGPKHSAARPAVGHAHVFRQFLRQPEQCRRQFRDVLDRRDPGQRKKRCQHVSDPGLYFECGDCDVTRR